MVVLTMGLVFAAVQFPVGLINSRDVVHITMNNIDAHNAQVMVQLQIEGFVNAGGSLANTLDTSGYTGIRLFDKPNVLADKIDPGNRTLIIDNPESDIIPPNTTDYDEYDGNTINTYMSWTEPIGIYQTQQYLGDIGYMVSPPVDASDREVRQKLPTNYDSINPQHVIDYLYPAIFDVSLARKYAWSALYRNLGDNTFCFYIFTLRVNKNSRFAIQDDHESMLIRGADEDRRFPVPWRITLETVWDPANSDFIEDRFAISKELENILRAGSVLVDRVNGHIFKVVELIEVNEGNWYARVKPSLTVYMPLAAGVVERFWIFPPSIDRSEGEFGNTQPVVDVSKVTIKF